MYKRTYSFLENTSQIYEGQFGFRTKHSCKNAIQNLISDVVKGEEQSKNTLAVFIDLSKAFDTLSHNILYMKLEKYGIIGIVLEWYKSYLTNRSLRVKCNTPSDSVCYSDPKQIEYGAPQGSCLGPLLFSIFTNDLHLHLEYTKCILFADDTTIYMSHSNVNYLYWSLEEDMKTLSDWFKANLLTLNLSKSVTIRFGKTKFTGRNIQVGDTSLPDVTNTKFLGIWLDNKLQWTLHISKLYLKLKQNSYMLRSSKHVLNLHAKRNLYYAQIYSHLTYGLIIWGNMLSNLQLNKLQSIQNRCFKLITGEEANQQNFHRNKMLTVRDLLVLVNVKHGHRVQHSHLPSHIINCSKFDSKNVSLEKNHCYNTRHKNTLNIPRSNCTLYRKSYLYQSTLYYQKLPTLVKDISSEILFVKHCKKPPSHW